VADHIAVVADIAVAEEEKEAVVVEEEEEEEEVVVVVIRWCSVLNGSVRSDMGFDRAGLCQGRL
jgi:hypothetical protein